MFTAPVSAKTNANHQQNGPAAVHLYNEKHPTGKVTKGMGINMDEPKTQHTAEK